MPLGRFGGGGPLAPLAETGVELAHVALGDHVDLLTADPVGEVQTVQRRVLRLGGGTKVGGLGAVPDELIERDLPRLRVDVGTAILAAFDVACEPSGIGRGSERSRPNLPA